MPPIFLFHGTADLSVPASVAVDFHEALQQAGYAAYLKLYAGKSHTDPIIEDLLYADEVRRDHTGAENAASSPASTHPTRRVLFFSRLCGVAGDGRPDDGRADGHL